jgi:hypothetical protein
MAVALGWSGTVGEFETSVALPPTEARWGVYEIAPLLPTCDSRSRSRKVVDAPVADHRNGKL